MGVKDIKGRVFGVPVNSEHKATECGPKQCCMCREPHIHTFWAATIGFFCTFFSCFAPGALGVYYKRSRADGGLELDGETLSNGGAFGVTGTIVMRILAGPMCDVLGARKTFAILLLIGIPGMILFAAAQNGPMFVAARIIIGLSLATFVTCQVWCSQFFAKSIVGTVNATAGGWGNLGGGITLLTMPFIMEIMLAITGSDISAAWRLAMIVPIVMHLGSMLFTYGMCFGVELCMNNKLVPYFTRYYGMAPTIAGPLGACFSLMNLFARSWGGILSDFANKKAGIRGRIWAMWITQTIEGLFCILMGLVTVGMEGPDEPGYSAIKVMGAYYDGDTIYQLNGTDFELGKCASDLVRTPATAMVGVETAMPMYDASLSLQP